MEVAYTMSMMQPKAKMENQTMIYFGKEVSIGYYNHIKSYEAKGTCPFCLKAGFTNRYGSFKKHLKACFRKNGEV